MNVGEIALWGALASGVAAIALAFFPERARWLDRAVRLHAAFLVSALLVMLLAFALGDTSLNYVWEHTRTDYPVYYRLSGLWGGEEGTLLLWTTAIAVFLAVERVRARSARTDERAAEAARWTRHATLLLAALTTGFTALALASDTFGTTPQAILAGPTRVGRGLTEVLLTPFMVIHPPLQFTGYALIAMPAALALAAWSAGVERDVWAGPALRWGRWAWLVATVGLGLGGLWAYYVLSFGGYWAWDPVEVANLLPWLALTAFMHAGKYLEKFGDYRVAAPLFAFAAWWFTIFATFATRSGLWVSVHAFTDPNARFEPDALLRLLSIMDVHTPTRALVGLLGASLFVLAALALRAEGAARFARGYAIFAAFAAGLFAASPRTALGALAQAGAALPFGRAALGLVILVFLLVAAPLVIAYVSVEDDAPRAKRDWLSLRTLMLAGVALLGIGLATAFLLDAQVVNGGDRSLFDVRAPFIVFPLVLVLALMLATQALGRKRALVLVATGAVLSVGSGFVFRANALVAAALPILAVTLAAAVAQIVHVNGTSAPRRNRIAGTLVLVAALLGMTMWANPPSHVLGMDVPVWTGFVMFPLAALGLLAAVAAFRDTSPTLVCAGSLTAALAAGYGAGLLLGLAALAFSPRRTPANGRSFLRAAPKPLRQTGIYVIHFAVVLFLIGYTASTYAQDRVSLPEGVPITSAVPFAGGTLRFGAPVGDVQRVSVPVVFEKNGAVAANGKLELFLKGAPYDHYGATLDVERGLLGDLYLNPVALHTPETGWVHAFQEECFPAFHFASNHCLAGDVDEVAFDAVSLPLVGLVWAGLWTLATGVILILAAGFLDAREARRTARRTTLATDTPSQ